nr:copper resistance protein [Escherichia coli]
MSIKNDGHYFCRAGGNRPDGLNEPVTYKQVFKRYIAPCKAGGWRFMT